MRKVYVARNCENTLNTNICPIIFVPGVMGTRLRLPKYTKIENGKPEEYKYDWDPDNAKMMIYLSREDAEVKRNIFDSDIDAEILVNDLFIEEGVSFKINPITNFTQHFTVEERRKAREISEKQDFRSVAGAFYREFLLKTHDKFKCYGMPVYAVGYDWRQSNWISGEKLIKRIDEILKAE